MSPFRRMTTLAYALTADPRPGAHRAEADPRPTPWSVRLCWDVSRPLGARTSLRGRHTSTQSYTVAACQAAPRRGDVRSADAHVSLQLQIHQCRQGPEIDLDVRIDLLRIDFPGEQSLTADADIDAGLLERVDQSEVRIFPVVAFPVRSRLMTISMSGVRW